MSEDEQESGCDTVDGSPASDSSVHNESAAFLEGRYIADSNHNRNRKACVTAETEVSKPPVRTMVVPPMRMQNNNMVSQQNINAGEQMADTRRTETQRLYCMNAEIHILCVHTQSIHILCVHTLCA